MTPSNLPPGVTENMIPGNRPEDEAFENWANEVTGLIDPNTMNSINACWRLSDIIDEVLEDEWDYEDPPNPAVIAERIDEFVEGWIDGGDIR